MSHLQEVWYVVLESLHRMLLPMLQWDKEGVQAVNSDFPAHHYTSRQCTALETMLEILRVIVNFMFLYVYMSVALVVFFVTAQSNFYSLSGFVYLIHLHFSSAPNSPNRIFLPRVVWYKLNRPPWIVASIS